MLASINALSDALVAQLANANLPALRTLPNGDTGRILLVEPHKLDQFLPPRVSMMPTKSKFGARSNTRGPVRIANNLTSYDAESKAAIATRAIHTDDATFEVRIWGIANENEEDPGGRDWDYTIALRDALIAAANETMTGCYQIDGGDWETVSHVKRVGRAFVFDMTIQFPVLAKVLPASATASVTPSTVPGLPFAPSGVGPNVTDAMQIKTILVGGDGNESSPGCE